MCTIQAPHSPVPHPNLVPVSLSSSRITHSSGVFGGASECAALPLTLKSNAIASSGGFDGDFSRDRRARARPATAGRRNAVGGRNDASLVTSCGKVELQNRTARSYCCAQNRRVGKGAWRRAKVIRTDCRAPLPTRSQLAVRQRRQNRRRGLRKTRPPRQAILPTLRIRRLTTECGEQLNGQGQRTRPALS